MYEIDAKASPRKPRVLMSSRSSIFCSLDVACRSHSSGRSSFCSMLTMLANCASSNTATPVCYLAVAYMNSMTIVCNLQQLGPSLLDHDADLSGSCSADRCLFGLGLFPRSSRIHSRNRQTCVQAVLKHLLQRTDGPLYDLASSDAVHDTLVQPCNAGCGLHLSNHCPSAVAVHLLALAERSELLSIAFPREARAWTKHTQQAEAWSMAWP